MHFFNDKFSFLQVEIAFIELVPFSDVAGRLDLASDRVPGPKVSRLLSLRGTRQDSPAQNPARRSTRFVVD